MYNNIVKFIMFAFLLICYKPQTSSEAQKSYKIFVQTTSVDTPLAKTQLLDSFEKSKQNLNQEINKGKELTKVSSKQVETLTKQTIEISQLVNTKQVKKDSEIDKTIVSTTFQKDTTVVRKIMSNQKRNWFQIIFHKK